MVDLQEMPKKLPFSLGRTPHNRKVIILKDPSMRLWPVLYLEDMKHIISGWKEFAAANKIRRGDICEFQLISESEYILQVRITKKWTQSLFSRQLLGSLSDDISPILSFKLISYCLWYDVIMKWQTHKLLKFAHRCWLVSFVNINQKTLKFWQNGLTNWSLMLLLNNHKYFLSVTDSIQKYSVYI